MHAWAGMHLPAMWAVGLGLGHLGERTCHSHSSARQGQGHGFCRLDQTCVLPAACQAIHLHTCRGQLSCTSIAAPGAWLHTYLPVSCASANAHTDTQASEHKVALCTAEHMSLGPAQEVLQHVEAELHAWTRPGLVLASESRFSLAARSSWWLVMLLDCLLVEHRSAASARRSAQPSEHVTTSSLARRCDCAPGQPCSEAPAHFSAEHLCVSSSVGQAATNSRRCTCGRAQPWFMQASSCIPAGKAKFGHLIRGCRWTPA